MFAFPFAMLRKRTEARVRCMVYARLRLMQRGPIANIVGSLGKSKNTGIKLRMKNIAKNQACRCVFETNYGPTVAAG